MLLSMGFPDVCNLELFTSGRCQPGVRQRWLVRVLGTEVFQVTWENHFPFLSLSLFYKIEGFGLKYAQKPLAAQLTGQFLLWHFNLEFVDIAFFCFTFLMESSPPQKMTLQEILGKLGFRHFSRLKIINMCLWQPTDQTMQWKNHPTPGWASL